MATDTRDLEFLFEIGSLRNVERGWRQHLGMEVANNLEHTLRVILLALIIARKEGVASEEKIIKMALVHDLPETRTTDLSYIQKVYVNADEKKSAEHLWQNTSLVDLYDLWQEYERRECIEAKIVKDADNLDIDLELKELEDRGSELPKKWQHFRQLIHDEKLYTASAKALWQKLKEVDVHDWHMNANKWVKQPHAGT